LPGAPADTFTTTAAIVTTVQVSDFQFSPATLTNIPAGTTITWAWQGTTAVHNVTFAAAAGVPADITNRTSGSVTRTFNTAGTFTFQCTNHPGSMNGSVTVTP